MATFGGRTKRARLRVKHETGIVDVSDQYQNSLQLYDCPPKEELSLNDFEQFAAERLKVLRDIESFGIRFKRDSEDYNKRMKEVLKWFLPADFVDGSEKRLQEESKIFQDGIKKSSATEKLENRRKDHISHFILRLAFSKSEDLRRWFLNQEMDLFRYRFQQETDTEIDHFLRQNNLKFETISPECKRKLCEKLQDSGYDLSKEKVMNTEYYKVQFTEAVELIRGRKVYLEKGHAFIPRSELVSIVVHAYRSQLSKSLVIMRRKLPYLQGDERLMPLVSNISKIYSGEVYTTRTSTNGEKVTIDQLDSLAKVSYPLCMKQLHETIRQQHHLKHFARLQFGLFLKGIGLSLEEAIMFWRQEFTKSMDVDKFDKQYAYNIRHSYGKEGKRTSYTPYSCMKIITGNQPGPGDSHGCPFKHSDPEILSKRLQMYKIPKESIDEIASLVKGQHYQVACSKYFEITHKLNDGANIGINHPNQYFDESVKILKNLKIVENGNKIQTINNEDTQKLPTQLKEPPVLGSAAKDERNADEEIKMDDNDDDFVMGELDDV